MIKEIVDLGKVVNPLASVFTMNVDSLSFVKVDISKNFDVYIYIDSFYEKEELLKAGVFREKSGNKIILFPNSFVLEIDKEKIKTKLEFFKNGLKLFENDFLNKIYKIIENNFDEIKELVLEIASENKNTKKIAVCVYYDDKPIYEYENLFEKFKEVKISIYFKPYGKKGICNILGVKDELFYPKANFYYPFSIDKKIVKFNLRDEKNLFLVSKKAIKYFFAGKEYLENFNRYKILGNFVFITAASFDLENIKVFEKLIIKSEEDKNLKSLVNLLNKAGAKLKRSILINFYFHTSPMQGAKEIVSYIKDVMPTYLVELDRKYEDLSKKFIDVFGLEKVRYYTVILLSILNKEKDKRELIDVFSKIVLNKKIDFKRILELINRKSEENIHKFRFSLDKYLFLIWLKGGDVQEIQGNSYEKRLNYVLENFELIKSSDSAKVGVCVGLILKVLSFSINDYDKKVLAFVSRKIGRDKKSLLKFVNPIFEKAKLHQKSNLVDINIACASKYIANLDNFDKEEFIFGMFLGDELFNLIKDKKGEENE